MALQDQYYAFATFGDSRQKSTTVRFRVPTTEAQAYIVAITQLLKDGTEVGLMLLSVEDMVGANLLGKGVTLFTEDDAADYPAGDAGIYNFDKIGVHFTAGFDNYFMSLPARDATAYTVAADGVTLVDDLADDWETFYTRFNALVLGKNGSQGTVYRGEVVS